MKKIKNTIAVIMCLALCLSLSTVSCAQENSTLQILLDQSIAEEIFADYAKEIDYIESKYSRNIYALDEETFELIKYESALNMKNENFRFPELMTRVVLERAKAEEAEKAKLYSLEESDISVRASFSILAGEHLKDVPAGTTYTVTGETSYNFSVGSEVLGVTLDRSFSKSDSYSVNGPADGLYINTYKVTHRTAFSVLTGVILEKNGICYIDTSSASIMSYGILASIGTEHIYCEQAQNNGTLYFSSVSSYHNAFKNSPSVFI